MLVPVGPFVREISTPTRANGARITLTRDAPGWPEGPLFEWRVYERERNGELLLLVPTQLEKGGPSPYPNGQPGDAPLVITLTWAVDKDKDVIRFEADVFQEFNTTVSVEWLQ